jgi:hypothetical protein
LSGNLNGSTINIISPKTKSLWTDETVLPFPKPGRNQNLSQIMFKHDSEQIICISNHKIIFVYKVITGKLGKSLKFDICVFCIFI